MDQLEIRDLITEVDRVTINYQLCPQELLDIKERSRTNPFPWRGQFSPELIKAILTSFAPDEATVLDPFVGSGTTLFESGYRSFNCYGAEINPSAVVMASTARFMNIISAERKEYLDKAFAIIGKHLMPYVEPLFTFSTRADLGKGSISEAFRIALEEATPDPLVHNIISNVFLRYYLSDRSMESFELFLKAFSRHKAIIEQLPYSEGVCEVYLCDARSIPLPDETADFVVTSPPYINVFNYHQNYRKVMELLGWDLLKIAEAEIGSNRRNRGNRFLTVVEYCVDMLRALSEVHRIIRPNGKIVIVIGRESTIRGVKFQNWRLIGASTIGTGLNLVARQERKYINRFGKPIYEDLLYLTPGSKKLIPSQEFGIALARHFLEEAIAAEPKNDVHKDLLSAIKYAEQVKLAPILNPSRAKKRG